VVYDRKIHEANCERRPILLQPPSQPKDRQVDPISRELAELESSILGLPKRAAAPHQQWRDEIRNLNTEVQLQQQLDVLRQMYRTTGQMRVRDNFAYIAHRTTHVIRNLPGDGFGQTRLFTPFEMFQQLFPQLQH
jgi:hypothetical protein